METAEIRNLVIDMKATGEKIRELRKDRHVRVATIQAVMGFSEPRAVYKWQSGESVPSIDNLIKLGKLLDTPIEKMIVVRSGRAA